MPIVSSFNNPSDAAPREFDKMMDKVREVLIDGIQHGFFTGTISVQTSRTDRREVLISVGKSYKYTIRTDDLPN